MAQSENAVMAKARAMFGQMLSSAQYDELLRRQSVQEIAAFLKEKTSYATALSGVQESAIHRGQLETMLRKDALYQYTRLIRYVPKESGIYNFLVLDMEISVILSCLRDIISDRDDEYIAGLPAFVQPYTCFDVFELVHVRSVDQLLQKLAGTPYAPVLQRCREENPRRTGEPDYAAFERALRRWYFATLLEKSRRDTRGKERQELEEMITIRAEMINLHTIYRLKAYFSAEPDTIRAALLPFTCRLSRRELEALIETRGAQEFMQRLAQTSYGRVIKADEDFIEHATGNLRYRLERRRLRFSTSPQVAFTAFLLLRGMEVDNIIRIIEGVRYRLPPERIERLLYQA